MSRKRIVVVSGLAGAGKSTAAKALEDEGFFVVDNLPTPLLSTLVSLADTAGDELRRLAIVIDGRDATVSARFDDAWRAVKAAGHHVELLYLEAADDVLVKRFKETRRRHPLSGERGAVRDGIVRERALLAPIRKVADEVISTDGMTVHQLKAHVMRRFTEQPAGRMLVTVMSFGFKHGLPPELDLCFDARFLPNPYFIEELRPKSGLDAPVAEYVFNHDEAHAFLDKLDDMLQFLLPRYLAEGKAYLTVAIGCTGGQHRSVALAEALGARMPENVTCEVVHRDVRR